MSARDIGLGNGTYYSDDNIEYQTAWVQCLMNETGFPVDFIGLWNEKPQPSSTDYVVALRNSLDAAGAAATGIIVMDGGYDADLVNDANLNSTFRNAIHGAGLHYPCVSPHPEVSSLKYSRWHGAAVVFLSFLLCALRFRRTWAGRCGHPKTILLNQSGPQGRHCGLKS